ncbi:hypothetical protein OG949_37300 [Streptomyces scopuliridis]|uniref:hypothetical protein n=1 Tax=Streptomyces scopuliridis TaxID=452529 RepID=UPI000AFD10DA|nr:hypothetical protein [Streptomyces scopuliridis]WSB37934.1 hypothetical protein OG949_37300 [Streptomyces scopuliridis]
MPHPAPTTRLRLYSAPRTYVDETGVGHDVLRLYATGHTRTGTPMTGRGLPRPR